MKVYYLPLEPYPERYTELLTNWTERRFREAKLDFVTVTGSRLGEGINVGQVLDAHGRAYWSTTQIASLVSFLRDRGPKEEAVIYLDDLFTPGLEALPYIIEQMPVRERPRIYARNHAQSVDPDDFTWPMRRWMRAYETMAYEALTGVICASTVHKEMMEIAMLPFASSVHVLGLPYDATNVREHVGHVDPLWDRPRRVVYASRLDREKQPDFLVGVMELVHRWDPEIEFVLCTGSKTPRSNDPAALARLLAYPNLRIEAGLTKRAYYSLVASSRAQLNTARQDFISYTAIEASTFGTPTLAPAFRSFPECLHNNPIQMYVPWSLNEAAAKLIRLVDEPGCVEDPQRLSREQDATLDKIIRLIQQGA